MRHVWVGETSATEPLLRHRNRSTGGIKTGAPPLSGKSMVVTYLLAMWCPVYRRRDSHPGSSTELENLVGGDKGKGTSGSPARPKVPKRRPGTDCPVVVMKRGNARGAKISELVSQEFLCACFHRQGPTIYNICTVLVIPYALLREKGGCQSLIPGSAIDPRA